MTVNEKKIWARAGATILGLLLSKAFKTNEAVGAIVGGAFGEVIASKIQKTKKLKR